jgi:hypothetical protein
MAISYQKFRVGFNTCRRQVPEVSLISHRLRHQLRHIFLDLLNKFFYVVASFAVQLLANVGFFVADDRAVRGAVVVSGLIGIIFLIFYFLKFALSNFRLFLPGYAGSRCGLFLNLLFFFEGLYFDEFELRDFISVDFHRE